MPYPQAESSERTAVLRRAAIFMADLAGGGAERMMLNLAGGLASRGIAVDLVLARAAGPYLEQVPPAVRQVRLGAGGVMRAVPRLAAYLAREKPQLLVTTLHHSSVAALLARDLSNTGVPVFVRESSTPSERERTLRKPRRFLASELMRRLYGRADGVIAVSEGVAEDIRRFYRLPRERVTVLSNPVVTPEMELLANRDPGHPWLDAGEPPVVLGIGRFHPDKDFPTLIRAFAGLRKKRPCRLIILGEGEERSRLESLIVELGLEDSVDLPGFVENPFAYMSRARLFALSSRREGLPGALIQAMACGCPVVATDCRSGPAEVLEGGRYGTLVAVGSPAALGEAMGRTLDSPPDPGTLRARAAAYAQSSVIDRYVEYFERRLPGMRAASALGPSVG